MLTLSYFNKYMKDALSKLYEDMEDVIKMQNKNYDDQTHELPSLTDNNEELLEEVSTRMSTNCIHQLDKQVSEKATKKWKTPFASNVT